MKPDLWLVQYLCGQRHAIGASPYDRSATSPVEIEGLLLAALHRFGVQPYCGLCGSRDLHFEHGRLTDQDWDSALKRLRALEVENAASRALIDDIRRNRN